jgi:hypothetical protein
MRPSSRVILLISSLLLPPLATPAASQTIVDERAWLGVSVQERSGTDSPWRWAVESQLRTRNRVDHIDVFTIRPLVGYDLTRRSSVWLAYTSSATFQARGGTRQEQRLTEQYTWAGPAIGGNLQSRFRLEQRFIEGDSAAAWRARESIRYTRPFSSGSRTSLVVWDELFVHLRSTTLTTQGIDQNRAFAGISRSLGSSMRFETGYLNQFTNGHQLPNRMNHILQLGLSLVL